MKKISTLLVVFMILMTGCQVKPLPAQAIPFESPPAQPSAATSTTVPTQQPPTPSPIQPTAQPTVTATPDTRLPPEEWQDWPVVPEATSRVMEIYQRGLELGKDPHHFSKIGDCHSVKAAFMGLFDTPGWYKLKEDTSYLQPAIDWYSGSFDRDGQGVKGGYNAAAVLSPLWADPAACQPGENPVQCEVRIHQPTFAFISLEVWWDGRTPERYEAYLREILDYLIAQGVVPILSTKADNIEGDHALNYTTAKLAYEYNLPLWNFWRAAQSLPNQGMDAERNDGFHISYQAWNTRSYTALMTLENLWQYVNLLSPTAWPEPTSGPTPFGGAEQIVFGLSTRQAETYTGAGVYLFNFRTQTLRQIFTEPYRLQAVSQDGRWLLVNQGNQLYLSGVGGDGLVLLTDKLVDNPGTTALWTGEGDHILWVESQDMDHLLIVADAVGAQPQAQTWLPHQPLFLFPSPNLAQVLWKAGICGDESYCRSGVWVSDLLQQSATHKENMGIPNFNAVQGAYGLALIQQAERITLEVFSQPELESLQVLDLDEDYPAAFSFSEDGSHAAVLGQVRSEYSGKSFGNRIVLFSGGDWKPQPLGTLDGLNGILAWSPDGQQLAVMTTHVDDAGYRIALIRQNTVSRDQQIFTDELAITDEAFLFVSALKWVP